MNDTNSQHSKFCGSAQTLMRDEQKLLFSLRAINHLRMFKIYNEQESNDSIRLSTLMYSAFQKGTMQGVSLKIICVNKWVRQLTPNYRHRVTVGSRKQRKLTTTIKPWSVGIFETREADERRLVMKMMISFSKFQTVIAV